MRVLGFLLILCLCGCADRYSLDKDRGPDPQGIVSSNPLVLPPDYTLRAPQVPDLKTKKEVPNSDNKNEGMTPSVKESEKTEE